MPFTDPIVPNPLPTAFALTSTSANTLYENALDLAAGVYTITFTMGGTVSVDFYSGTTYIGNFNGTTGQQYNLATAATNIKYWTSNSGIFVLTLSALLPPAPISGTLYTYTTSQTITLVGDGYCVVVGGGDGGAGGSGIAGSGAGGGSGGITGGRITLTGSLALTVGGIAGTTTLGSYTATGASGATGGSPNGVNGIAGNPGASTVSAATATGFPFITVGTTGAGGSGNGNQGGGSGIGTGGAGTYPGTGHGNPGTGYGAGGGGGAGAGGPGGAGTAGVCYIVV